MKIVLFKHTFSLLLVITAVSLVLLHISPPKQWDVTEFPSYMSCDRVYGRELTDHWHGRNLVLTAQKKTVRPLYRPQ